MRYCEDIGLKTNKGGIKHRKIEPEVVDVYPVLTQKGVHLELYYVICQNFPRV